MLWQARCWELCSSKGIKELAPSAAIMPAGLKICNNVNDTETNYKQGSSGKAGSYRTTECTETPQGSGSKQTPRGIATAYSESKYADGVGETARSLSQTLRIGYSRAK